MAAASPHEPNTPSITERLKRYRGVRVLVLGGSGFIGRSVASRLLQVGAHTFATVRPGSTTPHVRSGIRWAQIDLSRADDLPTLIRRLQPSITFNLAGYGVDPSEREADLFHRMNSELVDLLAEAMATIPRRWVGQALVHVGSAAEYGVLDEAIDESSPTLPVTPYGASKLEGTRRLTKKSKSLDLPALTARLFSVYGPGEHPKRLLPSLVHISRSGEALDLTDGSHKRDFTYVEDVATGLLLLGFSNATLGEVVNLATGVLTSVREFTETAASLLRIPRSNLRFGQLPNRPDELRHGAVSTDRLRALTAWSPRISVKEGIARTLAGAS